jgi:hypothetical protein
MTWTYDVVTKKGTGEYDGTVCIVGGDLLTKDHVAEAIATNEGEVIVLEIGKDFKSVEPELSLTDTKIISIRLLEGNNICIDHIAYVLDMPSEDDRIVRIPLWLVDGWPTTTVVE